MANANSYLGNYPRALTQVEHAYGFAGKVAAQIETQIKSAVDAGEGEAVTKALRDQFLA
jgi:hypothetical protein